MVPHPKTYGIPIGLENSQWKGWDYSVIEKYKNCEKNQLLYFNFSLHYILSIIIIDESSEY